MNKIFIRSPYYIVVNELGQIGSKVELRFKQFGGSYATDADIVLSKKIPSEFQLETVYNISPYAYDRINPIAPTPTTTNDFIFVQVKRYKETAPESFTLLDTTEYVCLNGYTNYMQGVNVTNVDTILPLFNTSVNLYRKENIFVNVLFEYNGTDEIEAGGFSLTTIFDGTQSAGTYLKQLQITGDSNVFSIIVNEVPIIIWNASKLCEPKYPTQLVTFVNKFGGWQYFTFFKAFQENIEVSKENYSLMQNWNYNPLQGQKQSFNFKKTETIRLTSGWVDENYSEVVADLLQSPKVLIDNVPVIVKTQSIVKKNRFIDKLISYDIEFEYGWM